MPKIRDDVVRAVLDRAKIEDVVGEFVTLRKAGVNMTGICPFHDDKNDGNFIVRPSTISEKNGGNTYHCFVCMKTGEGGGPVDFLMKAEHMTFPDAIRWLGRKYCIDVDDVPINWTPPPPRPVPPPLPRLEIPRSWVKRTMELAVPDKILFLYWLSLLPWSQEQRARLQETLWTYCVGGWRDGRVVFWGIDHEGVPRAAKMMRFYPQNHPMFGHRVKEEHPGWIYNQPGTYDQNGNYIPGPKDILKPEEHTILKPLFGAHLLRRYPDAVVNIVESEKTALVMANFYGQLDRQLWIACGGLKHLHLDSMQPLIDMGRTVWLWPDKDGVDEWQALADKLGSDKVQVYTRFFDTCWRECDGDKADCADIIIRMMTRGDEAREPEPEQPKETVTIAGTECIPVSDDPFIDPLELIDPRVREWREILRNKFNFNKRRKQ